MGIEAVIDREYNLIKVSNYRLPFPVKKGKIQPYLNMPKSCWHPTHSDDQGAGVIEGVYTDYIVDDLFAINFKYNQFK